MGAGMGTKGGDRDGQKLILEMEWTFWPLRVTFEQQLGQSRSKASKHLGNEYFRQSALQVKGLGTGGLLCAYGVGQYRWRHGQRPD